MDGLIFGLLDNGVLILGAFTGLSVERYLPARFQAGVGAVVGAGIGNTVSDGVGAVVVRALLGVVGGIVLGCIIPLFIIPIIAKYRKVEQ